MFSDIFTNTKKYQRHGWHKYSITDDDGRITGFVVATKDTNSNYDRGYLLNKGEHDDLMGAKRVGRIADAFVIAARINGGNEPPTYVAEINAEELKLTGIQPRNGRAGPFYILDDYVFGDAPF
jgi:hypothetical protein